MTDNATDPSPDQATQGLLANAQRVLALAESVRDAQRVARQSDTFSERQQHVQDLLGRLAPLATAQQVMADVGVAFEGTPHGPATYVSAADSFAAIHTAFRSDPETVFGTPFREARERAGNIATGLRNRLRKGWDAHVKAVVQTPGSDQLDVFNAIPAFRDVAARLKRLYAEREPLAQSLPATDDDARAPHRLASEIAAAWGELGGGAPPPVLDLLRAAGSTAGAPLDALTEEVRQWIDDHDLSDALRIRLAS